MIDFNYILVSLTRQMRSFVKQKTINSPLTFEQIRAIAHISRFEGLSQKELAELLESKPMATSKLIDALEVLDFVKRVKDTNDRRSYKIYLTDSGKIEAEQVLKLSSSVFQMITKDIDKDEIASFYNTMKKIQLNLQQQVFGELKNNDLVRSNPKSL